MPEMTPYEDAVLPAWLRDLPPEPLLPAELAGPTRLPARNLAILVLSADGLRTELLGDYLAEVARFHDWWDPASDPDPREMVVLARTAAAGVTRIYDAYRAHTRTSHGDPEYETTFETLRDTLSYETAALGTARLAGALSASPAAGEPATVTSPAHQAVELEDLPALRAALDSGADVHEEDGAFTLLHHAVDVELRRRRPVTAARAPCRGWGPRLPSAVPPAGPRFRLPARGSAGRTRRRARGP